MIVTVPVLGRPPRTDDGLRVTLLTVKGFRVRVVFLLVPFSVAVIVTVWAVVTADVVTVKVLVVVPPRIVIVGFTDAIAGFELVRVTD